MAGQNDIIYNQENDLDKNEVCAVYLTVEEKKALRLYARAMDSTMSDMAGGWIWKGLKQAGYLDPGYYRPEGF